MGWGEVAEAMWCFFKWLLLVVLVLVAAAAFMCGRATAGEALDEVNACRRAAGLRPFQYDNNMARAAEACCKYRAWRRLAGHVGTGNDWRHRASDFSYDPSRTAKAAGCGVDWPGAGWLTCCTYDRWTYAGAWAQVGDDGKRYMHIFVR